jgi:hypothetical protein
LIAHTTADFAAFVLDPDGNNIEAVWYDSSKGK